MSVISILYLVSVTEQAGLNLTLSESPGKDRSSRIAIHMTNMTVLSV